jgi:hypothetical protein
MLPIFIFIKLNYYPPFSTLYIIKEKKRERAFIGVEMKKSQLKFEVVYHTFYIIEIFLIM